MNAKNVRRLRTEKGITQKRLASLLGIHRTAVTAVESGRRSLKVSEVQDLMRIFDCSFNEITGVDA